MRPTLISVLTVAVALAACSDQQEATSPVATVTPRSTTTTASIGETPKASAKPTDQVGFTKVQYVESDWIDVNAGLTGGYASMCPAGTTIVAGAHIISGPGTTPPVRISAPYGNGWQVVLQNTAPGALALGFKVTAICIG